MASHWSSWAWQTCPGGVSSAVTPELLPQSQFAWGYNVAVRGGKPHTRPPFVERPCGGLPRGLLQGSSYFGVQGGMIVTSIAGKIYRIRIGQNIFSWEPIPLDFRNSGILEMVWMQQTIETLVIQDGQSAPILYNGSTARRAGPTEVPRGKMMAYGNGRLWVAINQNELVAGDIRQRTPGSELFFTETNYLAGGGALFFPRGITGMQFIPVTGAADFGTLMVFGSDNAESIRADVTTRDQWGMPGFVTNVFRDIGASGAWGIAQVNQDLYWRDSHGNIRSLANSISTNQTPGSTPISREVTRLVGYDSDSLLPWVSSVYFDNRLLMTSSPYLNISGGVSFRDLVSLDFSPISTMQIKAPPAYDGQWTGIPGIGQIVAGQFNGVNRCFILSSDEEGVNRLWEVFSEGQGRDDIAVSCGSGLITENRIESFLEYPSVNFSQEKIRKTLQRCDVWLSGIDGEVDLQVFWRPDNAQQWTAWAEQDAVCAKTTDAAVNTPHTWKNLLPEMRPQIKTFTIPDDVDAVTTYALQTGFYFQIRIVITGKARVEKVMLHATYQDDPDYRGEVSAECIENNVTDNEIHYQIPTSSGFLAVTPTDPFEPTGISGETFTPATAVYNLRNYSEIPFDWTAVTSAPWLLVDNPGGTLEPGQSVDVTVSLDEDLVNDLGVGEYDETVTFSNTTNMCGDTVIDVTLTVTGDFPGDTILFLQYDGPFTYPECATEFGNRYYLTQTVTGDNVVKYCPIAGNILARNCVYGDFPDSTGILTTTWSGEASFDMDCVQTGDLQVVLNRTGGFGAYDSPLRGDVYTGTAATMDELFALLFDPLAFRRADFMSGRYQEFSDFLGGTATRKWDSPLAAGGFFGGQFGSTFDHIYCQGHTVLLTMSDPVTLNDLGTPLARSGGVGSDAQTQTLHAFNGTTRTQEGNLSRADITVPVDGIHPILTGEFTFLITPDVGDPYIFTILKEFPITSTTVTGSVDFPLIPDSVITMTAWIYTYARSVFEEFSSFAEGLDYLTLAPGPAWNNAASFDAPAPNTNCWDDFENFPDGASFFITTSPYGYRWAGDATFVMTDHISAYDDFEAYPVGDNFFTFTLGVGWSGGGGSAVASYTTVFDDFESYTAGTITLLTYTSFNNYWFADGTFLVSAYPTAWDDFESYTTGAITVLDFTSTDNKWAGNGSIVYVP